MTEIIGSSHMKSAEGRGQTQDDKTPSSIPDTKALPIMKGPAPPIPSAADINNDWQTRKVSAEAMPTATGHHKAATDGTIPGNGRPVTRKI